LQQAPCQRPDRGVFLHRSKVLREVTAPEDATPKYIFPMRAMRVRAKKICVFNSIRVRPAHRIFIERRRHADFSASAEEILC